MTTLADRRSSGAAHRVSGILTVAYAVSAGVRSVLMFHDPLLVTELYPKVATPLGILSLSGVIGVIASGVSGGTVAARAILATVLALDSSLFFAEAYSPGVVFRQVPSTMIVLAFGAMSLLALLSYRASSNSP